MADLFNIYTDLTFVLYYWHQRMFHINDSMCAFLRILGKLKLDHFHLLTRG